MTEVGVESLRIREAGEAGVEIERLTLVTVNVDPASIAAGAQARVQVALPAGTCTANALVWATGAPAALEADLMPGAAFISAADTLQLPLRNGAAGATDGASRAWRFILMEPGS